MVKIEPPRMDIDVEEQREQGIRIIKKKEEVQKKATGEKAETLREIDGIIEQANKKKEQIINSIEILNKPRKINIPFLKSDKFIDRWKAKLKKTPLPVQKELQEPLLEIIKENGYSETLEGVKAGEFIIQTPKGEKSIMLTPDKLVAWKYGDQYYKKWYAYENCMTPYPEDPIHNSEMFRKTTQKLAMNWRDRDETAMFNAKTKFWLYVIGGIVIAVILFISTDFGKNLIASIGKEKVVQVVQTIQQNVSTNTGVQAGAVAIT